MNATMPDWPLVGLAKVDRAVLDGGARIAAARDNLAAALVTMTATVEELRRLSAELAKADPKAAP